MTDLVSKSSVLDIYAELYDVFDDKYETKRLINALNDRMLVEGPCSLTTLLLEAADLLDTFRKTQWTLSERHNGHL